jgi:hypothetical protein
MSDASNTAQGQVAEGRFESTTQLMRQDQVEGQAAEGKRISEMLNDPRPHVQSQIQERGAALSNLKRINKTIEDQMPRGYGPAEVDAAISREAQLREDWTTGMPTESEMRRNPAGAVDKHRAWEARHKLNILEWKNIRRRLLAGGNIDAPIDARDIANIEMFRPAPGAVGEMNMHNEQISGAITHYPPQGPAVGKPFSDDEIKVLKEYSPDTVKMLCVADAETRDLIHEAVQTIINEKAAEVAGAIEAKGKKGK